MKRIIKIFLLAAIALSAAGCSKARLENMKNIDGVYYSCNPEVLTAVAGKIPVSITVDYPKGYFDPKAMLVVTPVLVYEGGEQASETFVYQGSKVKDNYKVISKDGGRVSENFQFDFVEGMEKSWLELRSAAFYKGERVEIPAIKIADGVNVTYRLVDASGQFGFKDDGYQDVIRLTTEGQILYDVNSANVKSRELRSQSIKDLQAELKEMKENDRVTVTGTRIVAYASPEGGQQFNEKLSDKRAGSAEKAWSSISKGMDATDVQVQSVGQDWDGFKDAVAASNIQDKDLILRVLSMYSDPAVRESEIRNMSQIFTELKQKVFPELRRARFITTGEYVNYSDEELLKLAGEKLDALDEVSVLHAASVSSGAEAKEILYRYAADRFGSDKALFNLAVLALKDYKSDLAKSYIGKIKNQDADVNNLCGVIALREGNLDQAIGYFKKSGTNDARANLGVIDILMGKYAQAAEELKGTGCSKNEALAYLLNGDVAKAEATISCHCATADYIRAIIAARKGDAAGVKSNLDSAIKKDESFRDKAAKDVEFVNFR